MLKHLLILGYGVTGKSILKYLICKYSSEGLTLTLFDQQADFAHDPLIQETFRSSKQFNFNFIKDISDLITVNKKSSVDFAIASPGIKPDLYKSTLDSLNIKLSSDIQIFVEQMSDLQKTTNTPVNIYSITGTNGKSTVSALLHCLLSHAGHKTALGGNFGLAVTDLLTEEFEQFHSKNNQSASAKPSKVQEQLNYSDYILELSSYQLELTDHLPSLAATCLNLSPNHLDWHHGFENYVKAKINIYSDSKVDIINLDDPLVIKYYQTQILPSKIPPSKINQTILNRVIFYSLSDSAINHNRVSEFRSLNKNLHVDIFQLKTMSNGEHIFLNSDNLFKLSDLPAVLKTKHNISNLLAVLGLLSARHLDLDSSRLLACLKNYLQFLPRFSGLPFRCQKITDHQNICVYNDSKSTNLTATIKAIESVAHLTNGKIILIMGGILKEDIDDQLSRQQFINCLKEAEKKISLVIILSKDSSSQQKLVDIIQEANDQNFSTITAVKCNDLTEVLSTAYDHAQSEDCILFSPAGASFDLFKNYIDRGEQFTKACHEYISD